MHWWILGYFCVGFILDFLLSKTDVGEWEEETGVSLAVGRIMTMFLWPAVLLIGVIVGIVMIGKDK